MSKKNILLAIQNGFWFIQPEFAHGSGLLVQKILSGEPVKAFEDEDSDADRMAVGNFTVSPNGTVNFGKWYDPFGNAEPGSTAVIGVSGPIMKYDNCGDPGTKTYSSYLAMARSNSNIKSVVLVMDSPGGTVDGTMEFAQEVKNFEKPIVALVDGLMASAAYWIGSSARRVIANNETAMIGSIGTMISFADMQPMWEQKGVKFHTIYADASKDKNKDFEEARKGNYALLKGQLNYLNDLFLSSVKANRPDVKSDALTGKVFMAQEAVAMGLIDGIGDFAQAVQEAQEMAGTRQKPTDTNNNTNMKQVTLMVATHAALIALFGAKAEAGKDSVDVEMNDENLKKLSAALEAGDKAAADLKTAQDNLAAKEKELQTATEKATKTESDLEALKKTNPGATSPQKDGNDDHSDNTSNDDVWNLPHNKAALDSPLF